MFSQLKSVVDLMCSGITGLSKFQSNRKRKEIILNILEVYFFLKDCVDDGERLITEAGKDPLGKINSMESNEAIRVLAVWDEILRKQGIRLYAVQGYIFGQDHLAIINPKLQEQIGEVVGYKMDRTITLHRIGAALSLWNMFPRENTKEKKTRLVALMAGVDAGGLLDIDKITSELADLRKSLDEYRTLLERFVSDEELLSLSKRAREKTRIKGIS
ncbi:MAG: hypothetical protein ISS79_05760 [Phycisphaerae bacterium]|nr:hypothetical protein [Phycisphaerae bacterium]